ncbi:hypothetical protein KUCAC02_009801, partial [Chaenocephalus aceratus]
MMLRQETEAKPELPAEPEAGADDTVVPEAGEVEPASADPADTETEAAAATPVLAPAADPEVEAPKAEEPTAKEEEASPSVTEAPTQEESGPGAAAETEDKPTDPAAEATKPAEEEPKVEDPVDTIVPAKESFDLEDALTEDAGKEKLRKKPQYGIWSHHIYKVTPSTECFHMLQAPLGEAEKPEAQEASSGSVAGILSAIGVAIVGAATGYYTYQKKKLCFKNRQEADPEAARKADTEGAQADPQ